MTHLADAISNMSLRNRGRCLWFLVLSCLISLYLVTNLALPRVMSGFSRVYVVQPILWCLLIAGVLLASRFGTGGKLKFSRSLLWIGLLVGAFQVACLVIAGLFSSFGNSPYSHTAYGIFLNIVFFATTLVGIEFCRAYLLSQYAHRYPLLMMGSMTLVFTLIMISPSRLTNVGDPLPFLGSTCLPLLAENLLTCLMAAIGGPVAAIAYRGILEAFEWFSPILPDLTWIMAAFVGTLAPVAGFLVVQSLYGEPDSAGADDGSRKRSSLTGWVVTAIVVVVLVWVSFGVLGFRPVVVASGSMNPAIDMGDVVMVKEVDASDIHQGDVIQYESGGSSTIHRVIEVQQESSATVFITKGDANDSPDVNPVHPEEVRGRVSLTVPKVGWVSIGIKRFFSSVL